MAEHPQSQLPLSVLRATIDAIDRDILQLLARRMAVVGEIAAYKREHTVRIRDLKRELRAVHEATRLSLVFEELLDNRAHVLLVVDEYGGTEGLVTLEDVVETLIGIEIVDEADQIDDMRRLARLKWQERM